MFCPGTLLIGHPELTITVKENAKFSLNLSLMMINNGTKIMKSKIKKINRETIGCHKDL